MYRKRLGHVFYSKRVAELKRDRYCILDSLAVCPKNATLSDVNTSRASKVFSGTFSELLAGIFGMFLDECHSSTNPDRDLWSTRINFRNSTKEEERARAGRFRFTLGKKPHMKTLERQPFWWMVGKRVALDLWIGGIATWMDDNAEDHLQISYLTAGGSCLLSGGDCKLPVRHREVRELKLFSPEYFNDVNRIEGGSYMCAGDCVILYITRILSEENRQTSSSWTLSCSRGCLFLLGSANCTRQAGGILVKPVYHITWIYFSMTLCQASS